MLKALFWDVNVVLTVMLLPSSGFLAVNVSACYNIPEDLVFINLEFGCQLHIKMLYRDTMPWLRFFQVLLFSSCHYDSTSIFFYVSLIV